MKLSEHFDSSEFKCKCGKCDKDGSSISPLLISRLEKFFENGVADCIIITSGIRCPTHSVAVGGSATDAHTVGIACDCIMYKNKKPISAEEVAIKAEEYGFGGIGIIDGTAIHLDTRDTEPYANNHWYGDERTGASYLTFKKTPATKRKLTIQIDGKTIVEQEI